MRETLVHSGRVEIPHWRAAHDIHPKRPEEGKIDGGVELLHESVLLGPLLNSPSDRERPDQSLHEKLSGERQHDGVESDKREVFGSLAILCRIANMRRKGVGSLVHRRVRIGEEDGGMERVLLAGVDEVQGEDDKDERQRVDPCVLQRHAFPLVEQTFGLLPFRPRTSGFLVQGFG